MKCAALAVLVACGGAKAPSTAAPRVGIALAAALATADHARVPWRCTAADLPALDAPAIPGWQLAEHGVTRTGEHAELVVGVIADAGGAATKTLAALGRLRAQLEDAHVDVVVALGGMGATEHDLEATLGALATHGLVIALPGDLESVPAETAAIAALRARGATVLDGRLARWIDAPGVTLATLPGAATPIDASDGCAWAAGDVTRIYAELSSKPGVRVALLAEAPREEQAGDVSGELALVPTPAIDLVIHGPTHATPSPERTGGRDGARARVSPGTADATPRLPMTRPPAAGVLVVRNGTWTWRPLVDR